MNGEADKVTPIGAIVLLLYVSLQPSVGVCRLNKVDLAPFERRLWIRGRILGIRLHSANQSGLNDFVLRSAAITACQCTACEEGEAQRCLGELHYARNGVCEVVEEIHDFQLPSVTP